MKIKIDTSLVYEQLKENICKNKPKNSIKFLFLLLITILFIIEKIILTNNPNQKIDDLNNIIFEFNHTINEKYINAQNYFCNFFNSFYNQNFENLIQLTNVSFNGNYQMYVYKDRDIVSSAIIRQKNWEVDETNHILNTLNYYSKKKNIKNEDIYILDIGANIGWYSIILGRYGYKIIGFEPSDINYYILKKNYCLNKGINVTFINKGLNTEEKICDLYNLENNEGNGMVICDKKIKLPNFLQKTKRGEIILTKLSSYIPFLKAKNLALIKIDVEGFEGKVIEGGIELITKYHIPFIILELSPYSLQLHGTDPKEFLQIFENNGYKISRLNFLDRSYCSIDDIIKNTKHFIELYIVYTKIFEN